MNDYWNKDVLVIGCGNILFGDDGFGPEAVEYLQSHYTIPDGVGIINAGLSIREILFNITLSERRPTRIIIVDAVDFGRTAGEIFELDVSELPAIKIDDFSMHQLPTSNLLNELKQNCSVDIRIFSTQIQFIPDEVSPGLSPVIRDSIPMVCEKILKVLK
jgi:coenzyme F420 hydrogenase subunit delta